jgi:hypothetical protein
MARIPAEAEAWRSSRRRMAWTWRDWSEVIDGVGVRPTQSETPPTRASAGFGWCGVVLGQSLSDVSTMPARL